MMKRLSYLLLTCVIGLGAQDLFSESITSNVKSYLETCVRASMDPEIFKIFRSLPTYKPILEVGQEGEFADYLRKHVSPNSLKKLKAFRQVDEIGNPITYTFSDLGAFSGTTLRYIIVADQIKQFFNLPNNAKIAEIGAGFGGQCFVLSQLQSFSKYYIYDLPEVNMLIRKFLETLEVNNVIYMPLNDALPDQVDLVISNYAFTECDASTKKNYFEKVIKKAIRGYMLCNTIAAPFDDLIEWLKENNMHPRIYDEPVFSYTGNKLIVWDNSSTSK